MFKFFIKIGAFIGLFALIINAQSESSNVPSNWQTLAEQTNYQKTWRYRETVDFAQRLAQNSELLKYQSFGKSGEGRDLPLLIATEGKTFSPETARRQNKAVILIQAGIHAGEIDGKDAGLALLRDVAITKTRRSLLKDVVILFVPIYNVDGHELFSPYNRINQNGPQEMGWRATSAGLNLNRDYMKADAPETRAFLKLWNTWKPDFFIDSHVTNGADYRYNVTYEFAHFEEVSPFVRDWMNDYFEKKIVAEIEREGNILTRYLEFVGREVKNGIATFIATPRFATGYSALRNRPGLLLETHSLKPYKSRVRGTYDTFWKTVEEIGRSKKSLLEANRKADKETLELSETQNLKFPLRIELTQESEPFQFKGVNYHIEESEVSGRERIVYSNLPLDITIPKFDKSKVTAEVSVPKYYLIPPQWQSAIEVLQFHGIKFQRLSKPLEIEVESYRLSEPKWSSSSFESRLPLSCKITAIEEKRTYPANSVVVAVNQETARVILHLLEPQSPDSFVSWGFFNAIFEQKEYFSDYIMEERALQMLRKDRNLRREFAEKLKDEKFANNPNARLRFFYEKSPYFDKRIGVYPIGRVMKEISLR